MAEPNNPSREQAFALLKQYNKEDAHIKHALSVEAAMRYMARKYKGDEDNWGITGLIHDLDFEMYPDEHCKKTAEILKQNNWPEEYIHAVMSHGYGIFNDIRPETLLEKTLYAVDELTGFVAACALVRPSKSVMDLEAKSVKKKWKQKSFAAGVDREVIGKGAEMLGVELPELITDVIMGMREKAKELGL